MAKSKPAKSLSDIYNDVAKRADKSKTQINVTDTKRVLACFFDVLEDLSPDAAFDIVTKGLKAAKKRRR